MKELSPEQLANSNRQMNQQNQEQQPAYAQLTRGQQRMMNYDGFIGGDCDDSYNDLSGEIISIEDTYKEMSQYKKSVGSKESM